MELGCERPCLAAVGLDGYWPNALCSHAGLTRERHGEGEQRQQGRDFGGIGEVVLFEIEAACLEIADLAVDVPAGAIAGERPARA